MKLKIYPLQKAIRFGQKSRTFLLYKTSTQLKSLNFIIKFNIFSTQLPIDFFSEKTNSLGFLESPILYQTSLNKTILKNLKIIEETLQQNYPAQDSYTKNLVKYTSLISDGNSSLVAFGEILQKEKMSSANIFEVLTKREIEKKLLYDWVVIKRDFHKILDLEADKIGNKEEYIKIFPILIDVLYNLNILDLELWRKAIRFFFRNMNLFAVNEEFLEVFKHIKKFLGKFNKNNDIQLTQDLSLFSIEEKELLSIIDKNIFSSLYKKLSHLIIDPKVDISKMAQAFILVSQITDKFTRVSHIDFFQRRQVYRSLQDNFIRNLGVLQLDTILLLYMNFIACGINNKVFLDSFHKHFIDNMKKLELLNKEFVREVFLNSFCILGTYNMEIYDTLIKKYIEAEISPKKKGDDNRNTKKIARLAYDMIVMKNHDNEIWDKILIDLENVDENKMHMFEKKSLHIALKLASSKGFFTKELKLISQKLLDINNKLNVFCLGLKHNKNYDNIFKGNLISNGEQLDCCKNDYENQLKHLANITEKFRNKADPFQEQKIRKSNQEIYIEKSIRSYFEKYIAEKFEIITDESFCLFKIDLAIYLKDTNTKIALEIIGYSYQLENGDLIGKKQRKIDLLKLQGWVPVMVCTGEKSMNAMLGAFSKKTEFRIGELIVLNIEKVLQRNLERKKI